MPTFELECHECAHQFEVFTGMNSPIPKCPECGGDTYKIICNTTPAIWKTPSYTPTQKKRFLTGYSPTGMKKDLVKYKA